MPAVMAAAIAMAHGKVAVACAPGRPHRVDACANALVGEVPLGKLIKYGMIAASAARGTASATTTAPG
jgi:hypothetical protein